MRPRPALLAAAILAALPGARGATRTEAPLPSPGTKAMAQRLQEIIRASDPIKNPCRNADRAVEGATSLQRVR